MQEGTLSISATYAAGDSVSFCNLCSRELWLDFSANGKEENLRADVVERILTYKLHTFIEFKTSLTTNHNEIAESHFLDTHEADISKHDTI
jgi:hypothetical protein